MYFVYVLSFIISPVFKLVYIITIVYTNPMKYHFEPKKGWMNDPNGLIYYKGQYHAFFQHNPYSTHWDTMHWGHAVSKDLIHWQELDIALYPDQPYENDGGCFSGSAIVKDDRLYLFYTSVSHELGQTQSVAYSDDGITFHKYENNPIIKTFPSDGCAEFRDPKVYETTNGYMMVIGSMGDGKGRVLRYYSDNLLDWNYAGILFEAEDYDKPIECPDFFPMEDKYVLMYSEIGKTEESVRFVIGSYDGDIFTPENDCRPEHGPQFYAPQTFLAPDGRRILIGWFYDWQRKVPKDAVRAGAFTIPRELRLDDNKIKMLPVREAAPYLTNSDNTIILDDDGVRELFINGGEESYSIWL